MTKVVILFLTFNAKAMKTLHNKVDKEVLKAKLQSEQIKRVTLSFYKYYQIQNPDFFRNHVYILLESNHVFGRIYIAREGINAQLSVPESLLDNFKSSLDTITFLEDVRLNFAIEDDGKSFYKLTIKVKDKIVADGLLDDTFDASNRGVHLNASAFNKLAQSPDSIIVDMRNHYESEVGHFKSAIIPDVETFKEALPVVEKLLEDKKDKNIIMYCTGGIRCEKASAYYKHKGFNNVYQLEGGIIEYARQVELLNLENEFIGKNFVFDERLGERISEEVISQCHQCGAVCDTHVNCKNDACHILFIQCKSCAELYEDTCSTKCKDFIALPKDRQVELRKDMEFNGTKFGKGRYKAARQQDIDLT